MCCDYIEIKNNNSNETRLIAGFFSFILMVKKTFILYKDSFTGLSTDIWWLAFITFINRAGTMVIPFLSIYLEDDLNLSGPQIGWIMASFGVGSSVGSVLGGKLTDKIGYYKVMFWSLFLTGFLFIGLQFITTFWGFVGGVFITMVVADTFRPALFVSLNAYSKPENQTRSLTLLRLAINLGFTFGPAMGGLIITTLSYKGLFWIDGITCILAIILFRFLLKNKPFDRVDVENESEDNRSSIFKDKPYMIFLGIVFLMAFVFWQLIVTMPLFYKEIHGLNAFEIGLLMSLNGGLIFITEMPLIHKLEKSSINKIQIIGFSLALFGLSFLVLNLTNWIGILIIGMTIITVAEMLAFPFTNKFAMTRAIKGKEGIYMAAYTTAFGIATIFSAKFGFEIVDKYGYDINWYIMGGLSAIAVLLSYILKKKVAN